MPVFEISYKEVCNLTGKKWKKEDLEEILPDLKCEVENINEDKIIVQVASDRIDLLSVEGISRALSFYKGRRKNYKVENSNVVVHKSKVESRPFIYCGIVENIEISDSLIKSLMQFQEKLHDTFGRKRKKIAIGLHDLDKVKSPFIYKEVLPEEVEFIPLGMKRKMNLKKITEEHPKGKEYARLMGNFRKWPIILDSENNILSFPPIINGVLTEVTEKTKNIFIDVTGTDEKDVKTTLNVLLTAFADRGGKIKFVKIKENGRIEFSPDFSRDKIEISLEEINKLIGINLDKGQVKKYLQKMDYLISFKNDKIIVEPPFYRSDFLHNVDIIEDIIIGIGLNNLEKEVPNLSTIGMENPLEKFSNKLRDLISGFGYQEFSNPVLTGKENQFTNVNKEKEIIELKNPVSENYNVVRNSLLPQILSTLSQNKKEEYPQKIFECGDVVVKNEKLDEKSETLKFVSGVICQNEVDFNLLKGEIEGLFEILNLAVKFRENEHSYFIKGRSTEILLDNKKVGEIGEIHPQVLNNFKLEFPVVAFEINLSEIFK